MASRIWSGLVVAVAGTLVVAKVLAMPVLQPTVKEYKSLGGAFEARRLPVFHQNQRQCEIAADETFVTGGKAVWDGASCAAKGVYIAIAGSACGERLVRDFRLEVPAKKQGYAIVAEDGRVAIVGSDPVGALYGAVTFAQMAKGGAVEAAHVRDWPDVAYRTSVSFGRGLMKFAHGARSAEDKAAAVKAGLDIMLRHKLNMFGDLFSVTEGMSEEELKSYREFGWYAGERGIYYNHYSTTAVYTRQTYPKGKTYDAWPCVKSHVSWDDAYYCWADDALTEAAANRCCDFLSGLGMEHSIINIHPVDGGSWQDPEAWSHRCPKCRARWNDHERWKASVNQYNIWLKVLRRRLPEAVVGSCIYPYTFNALLAPENERTEKWSESMPEFWDKLDKGLSDKDFYFSSWITTPDVIREIRKLVPERPFHFSDTYPLTAGIFATYHRKLGSGAEGGRNFATTQGTEAYLQLETLILSGEYLWDLGALGAEAYDGYTYYDGEKDHVGPQVVMTNSLVRICRTLYGNELAPYMQRVLSSGVMPEYLKDPAAQVAYWNSSRSDPNYDPAQPEKSLGVKNLKYAPIVDTTETMLRQVRAAETCVKALREAEGHLNGLDRALRRYFMHYAKYAPFWLATARTLGVVRQANDAMGRGDNETALAVLKEGRGQVLRDFNLAEKTFARLAAESDTWTSPMRPDDPTQAWKFDRKTALLLIDRTESSARVTLSPRKIGRFVKLGVFTGDGAKCIKPYFDRFENVKAEVFDSLTLAELDRFDCVFLPACDYDKSAFFANVTAYVERGGGGVFLEGPLCGNARFDAKTPFPEIVKTAPEHVENFGRQMVFADGRKDEMMYVDYFRMTPGPKGEVLAYGPNGTDVLAVRGLAGLGKAVFFGSFNLGSFGGNDYSVKTCPLFGANAKIASSAVEYMTGVRLKLKGE